MGQKKKCMVIASAPIQNAGLFSEYDPKDCYVVCADAGLSNAKRFGITPDLIVGDFDSFSGDLPDGIETVRLKVEKDETDTLAAVKEAMKRGLRDFVLLGVLGGEREDHTFANYCVLQYLCRQDCKAVLLGERCRVFLISCGRLTLSGVRDANVSVFPFGCSACRVSYLGMKYPLTNAVLNSEDALGVSNRVEEEEARIVVHEGDALVFVGP